MDALTFLEKHARGLSDAELNIALKRAGYNPHDPVFQTRADKEALVFNGNVPSGYGIGSDFVHGPVSSAKIRGCT